MKATPTTGPATRIDRPAVPMTRRRSQAAPNSRPIADPDANQDPRGDGIQPPSDIGSALPTTQQRWNHQPAVADRITEPLNDLHHVGQHICNTAPITPGPAAGVSRRADREPETHLDWSMPTPTPADVRAPEDDDPTHERRYARKPATGNAKNVLIVDDDPDQLHLLTTYFVRAGCSVISLADAEHALALPRNVDLDLMVLDLRLPGMDGWELTGRLRAIHPRCPIAITSVLDIQDYPAADAALPKPVTKAHIQNLLSATVQRWDR